MAKKLQYEIGFSINNKEKVKKELDDLQSSLINIVNSDKNTIKFDVDFKEASKSARELSGLLNSAFDVQTGRFNISKFEQGLKEVGKQAGLTAKEIGNTGKYTTVAQEQLQQYITSLKKAGPEGEQAFLKLASAITKSQAPLVEITKTMDKLWITMKNTVRWQLTSSVLNSMQGAVSSAYGYAKDLDQSLNNIRIVTGKSAEEMKDFAKNANEAAQALNTTTTKYTDAALIYYQQGDTEQQVEEKAQITIDAANAAGTSAERMSEYLTAVWNSYQAGSEELELFVDKMAAVGAATASSLEEISTAMTKVASTANTVGVNFDQLTSIIATVGSVTRNSPETVGTAFKTIFARIGDLKLGETTEEGMTLGSVSSELNKVGVSILDVNGDLRNLGTVVEEIGEKWQIWNTAQKTAIAQAIAGRKKYLLLA